TIRGGISYTDRNVFGKGLSWNTQLKASLKGGRIESSLSDSSFLGLPVTGSIQSFAQYRQFPTFTDRRLGSVFALSKHWNRLKGSVGYSFENSRTTGVEEGAVPFEALKIVNLGTVFTRWVMDDRNHILSPDQGSKHEVGLEFSDRAFGGEISFNKFTGSTSWLFPLDDSAYWVLAMRAEGGVLVRSGDTPFIPIQFRFFSGGADSVRSFREDELSPRRDSDFVGGEFYSTGSVELRMPLVKHLNAALFADAGNVIERRQNIRLRNYRYALGAGLRYNLPIGPIRLDWGWNPTRRSDEDLWALHLSIGFPF
ncbi:MAG: outer membrane protein assembly factor, partial [Planctomycetota bacterium]